MKRILDWVFDFFGVAEEARFWWTRALTFYLAYVWFLIILAILDHYDLLPWKS